MNKTEKEIQQHLNHTYNREEWKELVTQVFKGKVQLFGVPQDVPKKHSKVETFKQLGNVQLDDGKIIALYELNVAQDVNLRLNRAGLNQIISATIEENVTDGVLAIFQKDTGYYRLTFSSYATDYDEEKEEFIERSTDAKRYTYLLGENEPCRTAAIQLSTIQEKEELNLNDLEDAFNVEVVSKRFFDEYIKQFHILVSQIKQTPFHYTAIFEKEDTEVRNYVKRFMGRLVFLKFIEKKGWLGVPSNREDWQQGEYQFLDSAFLKATTDNKAGQFVTQFLNPLFYDALNTPDRSNDVWALIDKKIPYLSGGLFEPDNKKQQLIEFPAETLTSLFTFFNQYNFTIDEHDEHDKEVGIDPEMLGHIFENLLEDNKDKGAFYTPKEIVRYMCQESLKEYLKTYLEKLDLWPKVEADSIELQETIAAFVEKKETAKIAKFDKEMATALKEVKICDPAIGSGAFPMGLLNEIFTMTKNLHDESPDRVGAVWGMSGEEWEPYKVKKNIIQHSIYGVDIEPGAVDIARLRFWLSLVIEEETPQPLPHLDYKIVVGNSLVSKLEDTIIDIDWNLKGDEQTDLFGNSHKERNLELLKRISFLQAEIFKPESDEETLSIELRNLKIDLLINQLELMVATKGLKEKPLGNGKHLAKQTLLWLETKGWIDQINKLQKMKGSDKTPLEFFDWLLDFPEVTNPEVNDNAGFDIVIGNPPYGANLNIIEKDYLKNCYKHLHTRTIDTYNFFIGLSESILCVKGNMNYIIPSAFFFQNEFLKSRTHYINSYNPKIFINLGEDIFDAVVPSGIFSYCKDDNKVNKIVIADLKEIKTSEKFKNLKCMEQSNLLDFKAGTIPFDFEKQDLFRTILRNNPVKLGDILSEVNSGITTGLKEAFIIAKPLAEQWAIETELRRPTLEGRNLSRYKYDYNNKIIIYTNNNIELNKFPNTKKYLETYKSKLSKRSEVVQGIKDWYKLGRARSQELLSSPKIICRETGDKIIASVDEQNMHPMNTVLCIKSKINSLKEYKSLTVLLNSKLLNFCMQCLSQESGRVFAKIRPINIRQLPLPIKFEKLQQELNRLYENELTKSSEKNSTDVLIYKIYSLTYDEALVIDPELVERLSAVEYAGIMV